MQHVTRRPFWQSPTPRNARRIRIRFAVPGRSPKSARKNDTADPPRDERKIAADNPLPIATKRTLHRRVDLRAVPDSIVRVIDSFDHAAEAITMQARRLGVSDPLGRPWGRRPSRTGGSLTPRLLICGIVVGGKRPPPDAYPLGGRISGN